MPSRQNEWHLNDKEDIRYCVKHKKYYDKDIGCQLCYLEKQSAEMHSSEKPSVIQCPKCKKESLFWNSSFALFECLNLKCKRTFTANEIAGTKDNSTEKYDTPTYCHHCKSYEVFEFREGHETCTKCNKDFSGRTYLGNETKGELEEKTSVSDVKKSTDTKREIIQLETENDPPNPISHTHVKCPKCKKKTLFWNQVENVYECGNPNCIERFIENDKNKLVRIGAVRNGHRGLCPFCGNFRVSELKSEQYKCNKCEKILSYLSFGTEDFGKEDRWLHKTNVDVTKEEKRSTATPSNKGRAWFGNEFYDSKSKRWRRPKHNISIRCLWLTLLFIINVGVVAYTGYLLMQGSISTLAGGVIIGIGVIAALWNISVLKYYIRFGSRKPHFFKIFSFFSIAVILSLSLCAFIGISPFAEWKDELSSRLSFSGTPIRVNEVWASWGYDWDAADSGWFVYAELIPRDGVEYGRGYTLELWSGAVKEGTQVVIWHDGETDKTVDFFIRDDDSKYTHMLWGGEYDSIEEIFQIKFVSGD